MTELLIIKHPLEKCMGLGDICDLDLQGRNFLDLIMTMIGDMQFRSDSINGTCARYFLPIDLLILQHLCVSAHIDCDKLRDHIRSCNCVEVDESKVVSDDRQTAFLFVSHRMKTQLRTGPSDNKEVNAVDIVAPPDDPQIRHSSVQMVQI